MVKERFAAAHKIEGYPGKCQNLHGHNWEVKIIIKRYKLDNFGMVYDLTKLSELLKETISHLDHTYLNELPQFKSKAPTAENIAYYIAKDLEEKLKPLDLTLVEVRVSEGGFDQNYVSYSPLS